MKYVYLLQKLFPNLTEPELFIIDELININKINNNEYIIAFFKKEKLYETIKKHEIAHGLFYIDKKYRKITTDLINSLPTNVFLEMKQFLLSKFYSSSVIIDELQAYLISDYFSPIIDLYALHSYREEITRNFEDCCRLDNI